MIEIWNYPPAVKEFIEERGWKYEVVEERIHIYLPVGVDGGRSLGERHPHQEHLLRHATLEDVFLRRAGRALRGGA